MRRFVYVYLTLFLGFQTFLLHERVMSQAAYITGYKEAKPFNEGFARVRFSDGTHGHIDTKGESAPRKI